MQTVMLHIYGRMMQAPRACRQLAASLRTGCALSTMSVPMPGPPSVTSKWGSEHRTDACRGRSAARARRWA